MEQIDPSTLAGDLFNMVLPEVFSSRVPSLPRLNSLRRSLSSNGHKNATSSPPPPSRRKSASTSKSSSKLSDLAPSVGSASDTLISDGETDVVSYASSSASTTRTSMSSRSSVSGFDYTTLPPLPPPHQQLGPLLSPPVVEDQHLRLLQGAGKQRKHEDRLGPNFGAHSYDGVDCRWSPSGIKWRYARQGAHLTSSASRELDDPSFERRSYIDGVAYYLRACPDNLTELETDILLRSAPWLAEKPRPTPKLALKQPSDRGKTFLHRTVQYCVAGFVVLVHALWCSLLVIGRIGARYESQYNISSHIMSQGYMIANAVGRHSVVLSARIQKVGDGRVGQLMSGLAAWAVDSFSGGILDGYGDGIVMIRRHNSGEKEANEDVIFQHS